MVKHMIIWKLKEDIANPKEVAANIKASLEGLVGKIEGLVEMHILTECFEGSAGDIMMDSTFESKAALDFYLSHPHHQETANTFVRPNVSQRLSFDYEI